MRKPSRLHAKGHLLEIAAGVAAALACASPVAFAQAAEQPDAKPAEAPESAPQEVETVTVVGTRAAQRTSIERKKRAATAVDSIAAEDVGKFPDQNVSEAISRIAGVALDRGDSGEGQGISVRGNGMETTRVDIDGMTVLNTNGALSAGLNAGGGRAADLRELPSAIIKSIDVFKGTTAAMTEGSLGGSVHIETRNGLDFDKPFLLFSTDGQQNSITEKWTPSGSVDFRQQLHGQPPWCLRQHQLFEIRDHNGSSTAADVGQCRTIPQRRFRSIAGQDLYLRSEHRRSDRDGRKFPCSWSRRRAGLFVAVAHRHSHKVGCSRVSGGLASRRFRP